MAAAAAAAAAAERPASAVPDTSRPGPGPGLGPGPGPGPGARTGASPPDYPARKEPRAGRRERDPRREFFVFPALPKSADVVSGPTGKHKLLPDDELKRRNSQICRDESGPVVGDEELGVRSDSENEEPISRKIRNISAFIRKTKNSSSLSSGAQRSRSCTDPLEDRGGKKVVVPPAALMDRVGISHSSAAGILLSSENSRCLSAPVTAPDRRLTWRAVLTSSTPLGLVSAAAPPPRSSAERSVSPESNDSISEELNHFKPIVCSPCTPPKRLADGRLVEPAVVKSTPRNLSRGPRPLATSYEASAAVLQKWRQIELDRRSLTATNKATLTSPVPGGGASDVGGASNGWEEPGGGATKAPSNKRKLRFDPPAETERPVKIRVPAGRAGPAGGLTGPPGPPDGGPPGGAAVLPPFTRNSVKLAPKDRGRNRRNQKTSKRTRKTKNRDLDLDQDQDQVQQDRVLALKLQRQFDLESRVRGAGRGPRDRGRDQDLVQVRDQDQVRDQHFLRSWMTQNCRRIGLRRSKRLSKNH